MNSIMPPMEFEENSRSLFLAGGISDCEPWQTRLIELLSKSSLTLLNPRRAVFPESDSKAAVQQIEWEYRHLRRATARLFWFPCETLCPIALFELGAWSRTADPLFVGVHPDYRRRFDVEVQLSLSRPDVEVVYDLASLAEQVLDWEKSQ